MIRLYGLPHGLSHSRKTLIMTTGSLIEPAGFTLLNNEIHMENLLGNDIVNEQSFLP